MHILLDLNLPLIKIVQKLNNLIYQNTSADKYITFFIGKLNITNNNLEYVNAGHNPPILFNKSSKEFKLLEIGGIILGMLPDFTFEHDEIILKKDDLLFAFTDGVNETINEENEEWGDDNLNSFIKNNATLTAKKLSAKLIDTLDDFKGKSTENYDDITYVIIKKEK
ncbi:MAG: serine/threonine-protein phosphatase, partial [Calditrichia bacterium]|nr:serine/threonine-protein phosphatase [Calditrichia bacterium]